MDEKTISILLVEDNPGDARLLREMHQGTGLVQVRLDASCMPERRR